MHIQPIIILVNPQLGENIGMVARAMGNSGLNHLRLVAPRDPWPNQSAIDASAGADWIIRNTQVFKSTAAAISDLQQIYATTARPRFMVKPVITPQEMMASLNANLKIGILFGCEKSGLTNEDVTLADYILTIPVNPEFSSLNLAQAVLLVAHQWFLAQNIKIQKTEITPAPKEDLLHLFEHLETKLEDAGYFFPPHKKPEMIQNFRNALIRAALTTQEIRTFRGIIKALGKK